MSKLLIFLTLTNVIIYGVATFFNTHLTLFWFVLLVYLLPLILNSLLVIFTHQKYKLGSSCLAALTTTVCYLMFSLYFSNKSSNFKGLKYDLESDSISKHFYTTEP